MRVFVSYSGLCSLFTMFNSEGFNHSIMVEGRKLTLLRSRVHINLYEDVASTSNTLEELI